MNLKTIYEAYKEHIDANPPKSNKTKNKQAKGRIKSLISDAEVSTVQSHYPTDYVSPTSLSTSDEAEDIAVQNQGLQPVEMKPIESDLNKIVLDENRIIQPNAGLSGLYEFVPATKIKGN